MSDRPQDDLEPKIWPDEINRKPFYRVMDTENGQIVLMTHFTERGKDGPRSYMHVGGFTNVDRAKLAARLLNAYEGRVDPDLQGEL